MLSIQIYALDIDAEDINFLRKTCLITQQKKGVKSLYSGVGKGYLG